MPSATNAAKSGKRHDAGTQKHDGQADNDRFMVQSPHERRPIDLFTGSDDEVFLFGNARSEEEIAEQRYQRQL